MNPPLLPSHVGFHMNQFESPCFSPFICCYHTSSQESRVLPFTALLSDSRYFYVKKRISSQLGKSWISLNFLHFQQKEVRDEDVWPQWPLRVLLHIDSLAPHVKPTITNLDFKMDSDFKWDGLGAVSRTNLNHPRHLAKVNSILSRQHFEAVISLYQVSVHYSTFKDSFICFKCLNGYVPPSLLSLLHQYSYPVPQVSSSAAPRGRKVLLEGWRRQSLPDCCY